jgi:hypothetical protein
METLPPIEAYDSLQELQKKNIELRSSPDIGTSGQFEQITTLIRRAVKTGRYLDHREDRRAAQDIINYWFAKLSVWEGGVVPGKEVGKDFDTLLDEFDPSTYDLVLPAADEWLSTQSDQTRRIARKILVRMFRLDTENQAILSRIQRPSLDDLEPQDEVERILESFKRIGVINTQKAFDGTEELWLRSDRFFFDWELLRGLINDRLAFRKKANQWHKSKPSAVKVDHPVVRFFRRQLNSIGKRLDWISNWIGLRFAGSSKTGSQQDQIPLEADCYRDRSKEELDYLVHLRNAVDEIAEWERIVRALSFLLLMTLITVILGYLGSEFWRNAEKDRTNIVKRERQRIKQYIEIVHSIAEYKQHNKDSDARGQAALWRLVTTPEIENSELEKIGREMDQLGLKDIWETVWEPQTKPDALSPSEKTVGELKDHVNSLKLSEVAGKLNEIIKKKTDVRKSTSYDKDTDKYMLYTKKRWCTASKNLVVALSNKLKKLPESNVLNTDEYKDYIAEFKILISGDMAVGYPASNDEELVRSKIEEFLGILENLKGPDLDLNIQKEAIEAAEKLNLELDNQVKILQSKLNTLNRK